MLLKTPLSLHLQVRPGQIRQVRPNRAVTPAAARLVGQMVVIETERDKELQASSRAYSVI